MERVGGVLPLGGVHGLGGTATEDGYRTGGVAMAELDLEGLLRGADDPLSLGLRLARGTRGPARFALLADVLARYGQRCETPAVREMARQARELYTSDAQEAQRLLHRLLETDTAAAQHMGAILLEAEGRHAEAASILQVIADAAWGDARADRLLACTRNLISAGTYAEAWQPLRDAVIAAESYHSLCTAARLLGQLKAVAPVPHKRHCRIGLVGSVTLDLLAPCLQVACFAVGIDADIYQGAFAQYQQEILDPGSGLKAFAPDVVIVASDWRCLGLPDESQDPASKVQEIVSMLRGLWRGCHDGLGAFVIQHNFEIPPLDPYGRLSVSLPGGRGRLLRELNLELWKAEQEERGVAILDVEQIAATHGKGTWTDAKLWHVANLYPATEALPRLTRQQAALLRAALGLSAKCLVLDLDGVLWGGVIGEDGLAGIKLGGDEAGEPFVAFQRYVQSLRRRGVVLAVCSKNNEEDARQPFVEHPEMVLSLDDIALFVANWRPKDDNLRLIAEVTNLSLDSLVFVDDSATERAWVRANLPEVEVPEMPCDPALYSQTLNEGMYFEALSLTDEDRVRSDTYRANARRKTLELASATLDSFLAQLQMRAELRSFDEANLPRIVQLINKTNQFNLTTRRRSESQVRALMANAECYTQAMRLYDRFGDNGLTGVLIAVREGDCLRIDTWLLSCRVLGREAEKVMIAALLGYALRNGFRCVIAEYIPTAKNNQVRDLYDRLGFERTEEQPDGLRRYRWDLARAPLERPGCITVDDQAGCALSSLLAARPTEPLPGSR